MTSEAPSQDAAPQAAKVHALYDASEVKRVLDDCASRARLLRTLPSPLLAPSDTALQTVIDAGYAEDFWISNVKIGAARGSDASHCCLAFSCSHTLTSLCACAQAWGC